MLSNVLEESHWGVAVRRHGGGDDAARSSAGHAEPARGHLSPAPDPGQHVHLEDLHPARSDL